MGEWVEFYRIAHNAHHIEAKRADGGEEYGIGAVQKAKKGQWLCRNPENGHLWVCSDEHFEALYCEIGKIPVTKPKKQEDGYRKGQSRHMSSSSEVSSSSSFGELFEEKIEDEQQIEEEGDGDVV